MAIRAFIQPPLLDLDWISLKYCKSGTDPRLRMPVDIEQVRYDLKFRFKIRKFCLQNHGRKNKRQI